MLTTTIVVILISMMTPETNGDINVDETTTIVVILISMMTPETNGDINVDDNDSSDTDLRDDSRDKR